MFIERSQLSTVPHSRAHGHFTSIYPAISRRSHGLSTGANLSLDNRCNYPCVYCEVDRSASAPACPVDPEAFGQGLYRILSEIKSHLHGPEIQDVTVAGNGEPMAFRGRHLCIDLAAETLDSPGFTEAPVVVITNGTFLPCPRAREAHLPLAPAGGQIWAQLDAEDQDCMPHFNSTLVTLERLEKNSADASRILPVTIQALFKEHWGQPPSTEAVAHPIAYLNRLNAGGAVSRNVQVYTVARHPRSSHMTPLDKIALELIASRIQVEAGLPVEIIA